MLIEPKHKKILFLTFAGLLLLGVLAFGVMVSTDRGDRLTMRDGSFELDNTGNRSIKGFVDNTSDRAYSQVTVKMDLLNDRKEKIGEASANRDSLGPKQAWEFEVAVDQIDAMSFKATVSSPDTVRPNWLRRCRFCDVF